MNMYNVKVNETHMCVLRKEENEDRVKVDFVELKFKYQDQLDELERMADNDNRSVLELHDFVKNSPLSALERDFNFCHFLDGTYQWEPAIRKISIAEYKSKIEEFKKTNDENGKIRYASDKRQEYLREIKNHVLPYMMLEQYNNLASDPTVVAYSHRRVGWSFPSFNLNDDLRVVYRTNFGYGMSSYFFTQIYYKGIGILPYSEWVHYLYANTSDIIKYTRRHLLENDEWTNVMDITAEIYNYAVSKPDDFVKHYIINEVEEMVSGLESILNSTAQYRVQYSYFNKNSALYLEGDELLRFKGEKISGALNFLDQLTSLAPICDGVHNYIQRIMNCNLSVVPELKNVVSSKKKFLDTIIKSIEKEQPKWDKLTSKNDEYEKMRDEMYDSIAKENAFRGKSWIAIRDERNSRFANEHPEYSGFKEEFDAEHDLYNGLCVKRDKAQSYIDEIQKYLDKIEAHKDYMIENNIAA